MSHPERGSAIADFAMVAGLIALAFTALLQLALAQHATSIAADCAAGGARYGALVGMRPADGERRARDMLDAALPGMRPDVAARYEERAGYQVLRVDVSVPIPFLASVAGFEAHGTGRALVEEE